MNSFEQKPMNYGEYTRYCNNTEPLRYSKEGDMYIKKATTAKIMCAGDLMCEPDMSKAVCFNGKFCFESCFARIKNVLKKSDFAIANLETMVCPSAPYAQDKHRIGDRYHCNAPIDYLEALRFAGFDALTMANNHSADTGAAGLEETIKNVDRCGFLRTGAFLNGSEKRYILANINGIKVAFISYTEHINRNIDREYFTPGGCETMLNRYSAEKVKNDISEAKNNGAEFCICYIHFLSKEYTSEVTAHQEATAQEIAEAGADCIMGSHAHAVQRYDTVVTSSGKTVPVVYSLGNFITSDKTSMITRKSIIYEITLSKTAAGTVFIADEAYIPCRVIEGMEHCSYTVFPTPNFWREGAKSDFLAGVEKEIHHAVGGRLRIDDGQEEISLANAVITGKEISEVLGLPKPAYDIGYSMLTFADEAVKGCVALVQTRAFDPFIYTSPERCVQLADMAIEKGAKLLITKTQIKNYPCLVTPDPFDAWSKLVAAVRLHFNPKTISVTGSIGKTSTTGMMNAVFSSKFNTLCNTSNVNSVYWTPKMIQRLTPEHEAYIQETMEAPPYKLASAIAKMVRPQVAIVTVVGTSHMKALGSQQRVAETCLSVEDGIDDDGLLILNGDDPFQWGAQTRVKKVYYAIDNEKAEYRATNIKGIGQYLTFDIIYDGGKVVHAKINCYGRHNVMNATAAFAAGIWAGMTEKEITDGLLQFKTKGIRQNLVQYGGHKIYLDCYNAAAESMESAFNALSTIEKSENGKYIAVLADIKETGEKNEDLHQWVGEVAADSCIDTLICYGESVKIIADAAKQKKPSLEVYYSQDVQETVDTLKRVVTPDDVVLFKGSHDMALESIVDKVWGTWFHEEYDIDEHRTKVVADKDLQYRIFPDHVSFRYSTSKAAEIVIPDHFSGLPVTSVGVESFEKNAYIEKVVFPSTIINIRYCAFYKADKLAEVTIPASVRIIDRSAFSTCANLKRVKIENGCTHLGIRAFGNCHELREVILPPSIRQIEDEAFLNCGKLTIYGQQDSYAQKYAKEHKIPFVETSDF